MQNEFSVQVDSEGYVLIPAEVRKAMGIEPKSLMLLYREGGEIRLVPGEVIPKRRIRMIPREELAQALIEGAVTPEGIEDAREGIRELGLDPTDFTSQFKAGILLASPKQISLDANVLVATGFRQKGDYGALLLVEGLHYVTSEHILREMAENLSDLGVDPKTFIASLRERMEVTDQVMRLPAGLPLHDDEDRQALAEAIGAHCAGFVTFNSRDFNALYGQTIYGVLVRHSAGFRRIHLP